MVSLTTARRMRRAERVGRIEEKWSGRKTLTVLVIAVIVSWALVLTPFFV